MKTIKYNITGTFSISNVISDRYQVYINDTKLKEDILCFKSRNDQRNVKRINELVECLEVLLKDYQAEGYQFSDKDIDNALNEYEEILCEILELINEADEKINKELCSALDSVDENAIEGCITKHLGNGVFQVSSENVRDVLKSQNHIREVTGAAIIKTIYDFIEKYLANEDLTYSIKVNDDTTIKLFVRLDNKLDQVTQHNNREDFRILRILPDSDFKDNTEYDYGESMEGHFYLPSINRSYNRSAFSYNASPGANYTPASVNKSTTDFMLEDDSYRSQIEELKELVVSALRNHQPEYSRGWEALIKRAENLDYHDINTALIHYLEKIGNEFRDYYDKTNKESLDEIKKLREQCHQVPEEVFGNDFMYFTSGHYDSGDYFKAVGWTQERIDDMNAKLGSLLNQMESIYDSLKQRETKTVTFEIDEVFIYELVFFKLTNTTQGKQYYEAEKALKPIIGHTITVRDTLIAESSLKARPDDDKVYGRILGVEL